MANYYYLGTVLPSLSFEEPPEISFDEFVQLLQINLTANDYEKTLVLRRLYDILNLQAFWMGEPLYSQGQFDETELEDALVSQVGLPDYVYDFLLRHESKSDRLRHFPSLLSTAFVTESQKGEGFLRDYLKFEREWRLVFAGFRAKKLGRDLAVELQYEDPNDELVAQILSQKDAKAYDPPERYQDLKVLFDEYGDDPLALQQQLALYRFKHIESMIRMDDVFSINRILAYMAQLMIVEEWFALDQNKGMEIVDKIVKETS